LGGGVGSGGTDCVGGRTWGLGCGEKRGVE